MILTAPSRKLDTEFRATADDNNNPGFAQTLFRDSEVQLPYWLEKAIQAEASGAHEKALDLVYDTIDDHLLAGEFLKVDKILETNPAWLSTRLIIGFLTATRAAKDELHSRVKFRSISEEVISKRGELEKGLLDRL